jgi:hypothetical protein
MFAALEDPRCLASIQIKGLVDHMRTRGERCSVPVARLLSFSNFFTRLTPAERPGDVGMDGAAGLTAEAPSVDCNALAATQDLNNTEFYSKLLMEA